MLEDDPSSTPQTTATAGGGASDTFARLHISPLDAELLKLVVPAAVLPKARNISFHTLETFPEKRYGFIELPSADAEKVRRKFHGSTLKGSKMRVEKARPEKIREADAGDDTGDDTRKKRKKNSSKDREGRSKKRKRDYNTVEGVLLPEDRKVKRGWTTTTEEVRAEKKSRKSKDKAEKKGRKVKSKYTDKEECLIKTVLPPNAPTAADVAAKNNNKKKKGKSKREVVVHEFENTTKFPSFLKATSDTEPATTAAPKLPAWPGVSNATTGEEARPIEKQEDVQATGDDGSGSDSGSSSDEEEATKPVETRPDPDSDESKGESESDAATSQNDEDVPMSSPASARPRSSSSTKNLSIQIPPSTPAASKDVHPLEALYKKSADGENVQSTPAAEPFSFFDGGDSDEEESAHAPSSQLPMTPFTKQDFEQRHVRSAAPTPDTAHPNRTRMFWAPNEEDNLEEEDEPESPRPAFQNGGKRNEEGVGEGVKESDFHSWFYENRRELSRSWMERRKVARKERRQRDNRAKGRG